MTERVPTLPSSFRLLVPCAFPPCLPPFLVGRLAGSFKRDGPSETCCGEIPTTEGDREVVLAATECISKENIDG